MTTSLRTFIDLYGRALDTAAHILRKGAEHAAGLGVTEGEMLDWRLIDDMQPLRFQLMVVCNFTRQWPARVAGLPLPGEIGADLSVAQFQEEMMRPYLVSDDSTHPVYEDWRTAGRRSTSSSRA